MYTVGKEKRIKQHIEEYLTEAIKLSDLREISGMSAGGFSDAFKRRFGDTPHHYIMRKRVELACDMMKTTSFSSAQVAAECGFYDQSRFCKWFRRITGDSPRGWRMEHAIKVFGTVV